MCSVCFWSVRAPDDLEELQVCCLLFKTWGMLPPKEGVVQKRRSVADLTATFQYINGYTDGERLFIEACNYRARGNGLN